MLSLRSFVRWVFAFEAAIFIPGGLELGRWLFEQAARIESTTARLIFLVGWSYLFTVGVLSGVCAWRIKRPDRLTRWTGLLASVMNLPLMPFGPVFGTAGLIYFIRKQRPAPEAPEHVPVPGDGTHKWSGVLFTGAQIAWLFVTFHYIFGWATRRGIPHLHSAGADLLVLAVASYCSAFIHEIGHFAAGLAVRFRMFSFRLGVFQWVYVSGRWRFEITLAGILGGSVAMYPVTPEDIRRRAMILMLGGPAGSAVLGSVGAVLLIVTPPSAWPAAAGSLLVLATALGLGDFLLNLVPVAGGVNYSDGARIWQLWRRGPWADYLCSTFYTGLSRTTSLRPAEWPSEMIERAAAFSSALPDAAGQCALAWAHFEDRGDIERAGHFLAQVNAKAHPGSKFAQYAAADRAFFEAFYRRDAAEADRWLAQSRESRELPDYWRTKAAVLAAHGDLPGAEDAWKQGWELAAKLPNTGLYESDRRQFRLIASRLSEMRAERETGAAVC